MNCQKVFAQMLKRHSKGDDVTLIASYDDVSYILKLLLCMPDSYIENVCITPPNWDNYDGAWFLSYGFEGDVWCSKAINEINNCPFKGSGYFIIDSDSISGYDPKSFVLTGGSIKLVNGDIDG